MSDWQYQRLIGVIFLVGAGCAQSPWGGLFFVIGMIAMVDSYLEMRRERRADSASGTAGDDLRGETPTE
jgi:hypothetical protein